MSNVNRPTSRERLDVALCRRGLTATRSEAENWIRLGKVTVNGKVVTRSGQFVEDTSDVKLTATERYVSRAGLKLASVASKFNVVFRDAIVLDVGSSTGGFTDYALQHGAKKVFAVDVGTDQLHPSLRKDRRVELHEKTDIREVTLDTGRWTIDGRSFPIPDIIVIDVSFISIREVLGHLASIIPTVQHPSSTVQLLAMLKPQFEAGRSQVSKGVIKNNTVRREILRDFESWVKQYYVIEDKADSDVAGAHGNQERFYKLKRVIS